MDLWLRGESNDLAVVSSCRSRAKRLILGRLFENIDRFLCIGSANRRLYEGYGVSAARLHPAPYAVDRERFAHRAAALAAQRAAIRRDWNIPEEARCVLFCGKFIAKKRPLDLVAAAQRLTTNSSAVPIHLLMVGSGELGSRLRRACRVVFDADNPLGPDEASHRSLPTASFTGFMNQSEISRAYVAADCLVLPSDYGETWGLVVNEAMASGLPSVVSDRCGCAEDLGRLASNRVFPCGDVSALAALLAQPRVVRLKLASGPSLSDTVDTVVALWGSLAKTRTTHP